MKTDLIPPFAGCANADLQRRLNRGHLADEHCVRDYGFEDYLVACEIDFNAKEPSLKVTSIMSWVSVRSGNEVIPPDEMIEQFKAKIESDDELLWEIHGLVTQE